MVEKDRKVEHFLLWSCREGPGRSFKVWLWMIQPKSWQIVSPSSNQISKETNKAHWSGQLPSRFSQFVFDTQLIFYLTQIILYLTKCERCLVVWLVGCPMSLQLIERFKFKVGWLGCWEFSNLIFDPFFFHSTSFVPPTLFWQFLFFFGPLVFRAGTSWYNNKNRIYWS